MSVGDSLSSFLNNNSIPSSMHNPARMSTPIFQNNLNQNKNTNHQENLDFQGLMSFKKNGRQSPLLVNNNFNFPEPPMSPSRSVNLNETLIGEVNSGVDNPFPEMPEDDSQSHKDYLILIVNTCKHSKKNIHKNIKLILFDLEKNKIAMLYDLSLSSLEYNSEGFPILPEIQLLNDKIHFCLWTKHNLWVFELFSKKPIASISPDFEKAHLPNYFLQKVTFSLDMTKMLLGFSNGDLMFYDMKRQFHPFYGKDCLFQFDKIKESNVQELCAAYLGESVPEDSSQGFVLKDFNFMIHSSPKLTLNVLTNQAVLFLSLTLENMHIQIENIKPHMLDISGDTCSSFIFENPITSDIDIFYVLNGKVHQEKVAFRRKDNFVTFEGNHTFEFEVEGFAFEGIYDIGRPGLLGKEMDSKGNLQKLLFYPFQT
jgi:hypothetical protein